MKKRNLFLRGIFYLLIHQFHIINTFKKDVMKTKRVCRMCVLFVLFAVPSVILGRVVEPDGITGEISYSSGSFPESSGCPSWYEVLDRDGGDGGHITVEFDGCRVGDVYERYTMPQYAPTGHLAYLEYNDIFIVWDEDAGHGSTIDFSFLNGTYEPYVPDDPADPNSGYVRASRPSNDKVTNWEIYRVTSGGELIVNSTGLNEHDAFHLERNLIGIFEKTDDVDSGDCRSLGEDITYTISWENISNETFDNVKLIDYLPAGVDYKSADPDYDSTANHTYTWELGDIGLGASGEVELTVTVNEKTEPGMKLYNVAELRDGSDLLIATATKDTLVCCWDVDDPNIIYVDMTATGNNNGVDWANAYSGEDGLERALIRARNSTCDVGLYTIYVAQGSYTPGNYAGSSFYIPEGTKVYGGFMSGGGGESMMMYPMETSSTSFVYEPEPEPEPVERTTAEFVSFVEGIYDIIEHLDASIEQDHENAENLCEIKTFLEDVLRELEAERQKNNLK